MSKYLFILLLLLGITAKANAQDMMLNGSFEECDGNAPPGTPYPYSIEYGAYWHNLTGTADLVHPCAPGAAGNPCFGIGCGRFGINGSGYSEYLYGQTQPLTAGQIYEVSFWIRKDYSTETIRKVGLAITETVPTPATTSTTPLISEVISSTQCIKLKACFTAQNSVTHYVTIGPFDGEGSPEPILYLVDSVSVMTIPPGTPLAQASLSASEPVLCFGEQVTLNGTASANETSYEWNIYNTTTGNQLFYSSGIIQGTAGTLTPTLQFPIAGSCYRAELTVYGVCEDVATVEFCIADPNIDFIFDGNPVCENTPVDLQVTGDNGWIYTWTQANDTLANGTGIQALTVIPTMGNGVFTVTVTTPEGCHYSENLHLNVSSLSTQVPPTMNGVNGTNDYTVYVQSGDGISFSSLISNNSGETVTTSIINNNIPTSHTFNLPPDNQNGGTLSFNWQTPLNASGDYTFDVYLIDNNGCQIFDNTYKFRIIVICDYCPICISYDDRTPSNNPLPPETKAGKCIEVGLNATVQIGSGNSVYLQAGEYIEMGDFFDSNSGEYEAVIDTTTCVVGCQNCCSEFNGFTYNTPIPNIFSPNGDGINDVWCVRDTDHPWCAFGATGFELYIVNSWQSNVYHQIVYEGNRCCPFTDPFPSPSSINWDGRINVGTGQGQFVSDGVYFYVLYLHGCGQTITLSGNISIYTTAALILSNGAESSEQRELSPENELLNNRANFQLPSAGLPEDHFFVFPNPTENFIRVHTGKKINQLLILDVNGKQIISKTAELDQPIDMSALSSGNYRVKVIFEDQSVQEKTIVKN